MDNKLSQIDKSQQQKTSGPILKFLSNYRILILLCIFNFFFITFVVYLLFLANKKEVVHKFDATSTFANQQINEEVNFNSKEFLTKLEELPPLTQNASWGEITRATREYNLPEGEEIKRIILYGYARDVTYKEVSMESVINLYKYVDKYIYQIMPHGWEQDNYQIADGVTGGQRGYKKDFNSKRRVIIYSFQTEYKNFIGGSDDARCPCTHTITVFYSDPFDIGGS